MPLMNGYESGAGFVNFESGAGFVNIESGASLDHPGPVDSAQLKLDRVGDRQDFPLAERVEPVLA